MLQFERIAIPIGDSRNQNIMPQYEADQIAWVWHKDFLSREKDSFLLFTLQVDLESDVDTRSFISADNRYELYCDGERIGMGPDRGDVDHWSFAAYRMKLSAGRHEFRVLAWYAPEKVPLAQLSWHPGFLFGVADPELQTVFNTGSAPWKVREVCGLSFQPGGWAVGCGSITDVAAYFTEPEWTDPAVIYGPRAKSLCGGKQRGWRLCPSNLPEQIHTPISGVRVRTVIPDPPEGHIPIPVGSADTTPWQKHFDSSEPVTIPAGTSLAVIIDFENYVCVYPELTLTGGSDSEINLSWREAAFGAPDDFGSKQHRDELAGKLWPVSFQFDVFRNLENRPRRISTLWWRAGRYALLKIRAGSSDLILHKTAFFESRYPIEAESAVTLSDPDLNMIQPMMIRSMQMCMHETYMDCPFYEQLMYVGDTRLEMLTTYMMTQDPRLPERGIHLFDWSRSVWEGIVAEHYPSRGSQLSCTFSAIWPLLVRDFAMYRRFRTDQDFLRLRRGVRTVILNLAGYVNGDGIIENLAGWSFVDWVGEWNNGIPYPLTNWGCSSIFSLHYLLSIRTAMELEKILPESGSMTSCYQELFDRTAAAVRKIFWDEQEKLFADDPEHAHYSMHAQCLAMLAGVITGADADACFAAMLRKENISVPTLYFISYLFDVFHERGCGYKLMEYKKIWTDMKARGAVTTWERPEPSRSDCHAWGAHLYYHYFATLAGIRPASPGFRSVCVTPSMGSLEHISGTMPHPDGWIRFDLHCRDGKTVTGTITLPDGCSGIYRNNGCEKQLLPGENNV